MRKSLAGAALAASLAVGGIAGAAFGTPSLAGAAESTTGAVSWVQEALSGLVSDGTITQEQADAVESALDEARPERGGHRGGGFGRHVDLSAVAEALGITEDELRTALVDEGQTIAELAEARGVEVEDVVGALVAGVQERLDAAVADGTLTQAEADERAAAAEERVRAFIEGELPVGRGGPGHRGGHGPGWFDGDDDQPEAEAEEGAATA